MQLLIDTAQETNASLLFIANTLVNLVNMQLGDDDTPMQITPVKILVSKPASSINGPSGPIVLHAHGGPAAPIDPAPLAQLTDALDPAVVFGQPSPALFVPGWNGEMKQPDVPAGTTQDPTLPVSATAVASIPAPPVPTNPAPVGNVSLAGAVVSLSVAAAPARLGLTLTAAPPPPITAVTVPIATDAATAVAAAAGVTATAPAAPVTPAANTAERDKDNLPWDARVHSETRKTNADGTWRYRRNLDPTVKATVTAELKAQYGAQAPLVPTAPAVSLAAAPGGGIPVAPLPVAPPPPSAPVIPQPGVGLPTAAASVPVPPGVLMGLPNAPQPPTVLGFRDFMSAVNKAIAAARLTQEQAAQACKAVGLDGIAALAGDPMKIPLVHAQIAHLL